MSLSAQEQARLNRETVAAVLIAGGIGPQASEVGIIIDSNKHPIAGFDYAHHGRRFRVYIVEAEGGN